MKVLVIDADGIGLDFCIRCQEWGHDVRLFIRKDPPGERSLIGTGLVERVPHWEPHLNWADLIVLTQNDRYIDALEPLRKHYPIFAPPLEGQRLELDRAFGQEILKVHGIQTIPGKEFTSYAEAENYVRRHPQRWVSKPTQDAKGNSDKALSYVSKTPDDMIWRLRQWDKDGPRAPFILQEYKDGVEFEVSGFFGGGWWGKKEEAFEFKKLMSGDKGPNTGEMGSVIKYVEKSKLFDKVLKPLTGYLTAIDYRGDIAVNCKVNKDGIWPMEFTTRLGWPDFFIRQVLHLSDPARWMLDLMQGEDTLEVSPDVAVGVVLLQNYPLRTGRRTCGLPIYGITEANWNNFHPAEVMAGTAPCAESRKDRECLVSCGDYIGVVTGTGETVRKASRAAYKVQKEITLPNSPWLRDDIGERIEEDLPELQAMGYADSWTF